MDIQALKPPVDSIFIIPQNSKKAIQKHVLNDMEVPDMIGGSRLQVIPRYLPGAKCDELLQNILACNNLRQYHMGHKVEPRLHLLLHEDASPMDSPTGVGYVYHGVRMKAQPFSTIEGIEQIAKQLAKEFGVVKWTIGIEVIVYASGEDSIGWHADDSQGETDIVCMTLQTANDPRQVHIKAVGKGPVGSAFRLKLGKGSIYYMNGEMQKHYHHMVPKIHRSRSISADDRRVVLVFRSGNTVITSDSGIPASLDSRMSMAGQPLIFGKIDSVDEGNSYHPNDLEKLNAHRNGKRSVDGNKTLGCASIYLLKNDPSRGEYDGEICI